MKCKLSDICLITSARRIFEREYVESGIPFIRGQEVSDGSIANKHSKFECYISKERYEQLKKKYIIPQKGDILITAVGTIGNLYYIDSNFEFYFKDGNLILFTNFSKNVYPKYLYYFMKSNKFKKQIEYTMIGAVQKALTMVMLANIEIDLPEYEKQIKIANIFSALDNKIRNNNDIIIELEKVTKTIYDYWFLQFEFPNKEGKPYKSLGGKMVWNKELKQEIPEGWNVKKVKDILSSVPSTHKYSSSEYKQNGKNPIIDQSSNYICGYTDNTEGLLKLEDCVVFGDHTKCVKYVNFHFARGADGTQILNSSDERLPNYLLYMQISNIKILSQGYSRYFKFLKDKYVIIPKKGISDLYINKTKIMLEKIREYRKENEELTKLSNYLLPLLMNGQVGFENIENDK